MSSTGIKKRDALNSPRLSELKKRRRNVLRNKIIIFTFLVLVILIGLSFLSRWEKFKIKNIEVVGNKVIDAKDIENVAREELSGNYFWLFPKTDFLIYPKDTIKKELVDKFKRFKSVSLKLTDAKTLQVSVTEREGKYLWCGDTLPVSNNTNDLKCFFLDSTGYIFDQAPYFSGNIYFKFYGTVDDINNPIGTSFLPSNFENIIYFKQSLDDMQLKPSLFYLEDGGDGDIYLVSKNILTEDPKIIFKLDSDFEKIVENLQVAINADPLMTELKNKYDSLLYIDLRFGNKVYYKFK